MPNFFLCHNFGILLLLFCFVMFCVEGRRECWLGREVEKVLEELGEGKEYDRNAVCNFKGNKNEFSPSVFISPLNFEKFFLVQ